MGALILYLLALATLAALWTQHHRIPDAAAGVSIVAGPILILSLARMVTWILSLKRRFRWLSSGAGDAPPPEVEGWHVSGGLGIALVSLRSGRTLWIDVRDVAAAHLPVWLRGPTQWGKIRLCERPMPVWMEWIAPVTPAIFLLVFVGVKAIDANGRFHWELALLFILVGPIAGFFGYIGVLPALLWRPVMELEGDAARVLWSGDIAVSALSVEVRGDPSSRGRLYLIGARPSWRRGHESAGFRPAAVFTGDERRRLGFNEAVAIKRIIEERASPQRSIYRA